MIQARAAAIPHWKIANEFVRILRTPSRTAVPDVVITRQSWGSNPYPATMTSTRPPLPSTAPKVPTDPDREERTKRALELDLE
ncbi:hypothetical protein GCM10022223_23140 [Kineosporia mesophila]|uniref:Uncharacterized protein n=1 Tax=Kineosporia mesophila TaxID=566012 RepID=A0ABP6ZHU2_9ACTN